MRPLCGLHTRSNNIDKCLLGLQKCSTMTVDWDHLRYFTAAATTETLGEAARRLGVNATTVGRRLEALEASLGVRLLERTRDGLARTEAGEDALQTAERIEALMDGLRRRLTGQDEALRGVLRVTTIDLVAVHEAELFTTFAATYPDVDLEVSTTDTPRNLTKREADVALRWTNAPPDLLVGRKLACAEYALYGAARHARRWSRMPLDALPWLGWDEATSAAATRDWMRHHAADARVVARFDSALAMQAALRSGLGVAFAPCVYGDADPRLRRLRDVEPGFSLDVWALTHADLRRTARVRAFLAHAADHFAARREAFSGVEGAPG